MSFIKGHEFDTMSRTELCRTVMDHLLDLCDVGPSATIADIGCGPGLGIAGLLERYGDTVEAIIGVDPSEFELATAKARIRHPKVSFLLGSAEDLEDFVGRVDATVLANVLHLIPSSEREEVLASCYSVLKPGGRLVANTMFYDGAIRAETRDFYTRWMYETSLWLTARGKQLEVHERNHAAEVLSLEQHEEMLRRVGFSQVSVEEVTYHWSANDWKALSSYSLFVEGATGLSGTEISLGAAALQAGIDASFAALKLDTVPRGWLFASAVK
jgi:ubiquinone/menaquinone biosynthesis C-methylase UbiE